MMAAIVLIAINIRGYFIGGDLQGSSRTENDAVDILLLQITSKLLELLVLASLTRIVLDVIRYETVLGKDGLPFGLLGAAFAFKDLSFFWSPAFLYNIKATWLKSRHIWFFGLLILSASLATFVGPASALLMIPTLRGNWPAGGASFWLVGSQAAIWPTKLDVNSVGGPYCLNATEAMLTNGALNNSGCIWYSTSSLAQTFQAWHLFPFANLTIIDSICQRLVGNFESGPYSDAWALSSSAAVCLLSNQLSNIWNSATFEAPLNKEKFSSYNNIKYRIRPETIAKVQSPLPAVRTVCYNEISYYSNATSLRFPILPEYTKSEANNSFEFSVTTIQSTSILTQWLPVPEKSTTTLNGTQSNDFPSAFMAIQIPYQDNKAQFAAISCSIDARWVVGDNKLTNVHNLDKYPDSPQHGQVKNSGSWSDKWDYLAPVDDGTWRKISMDLDWLYGLTPILNSSVRAQSRELLQWTSYARLLADTGFDNSTSMINNYGDITSALQITLSTLVAEGLARVGFSENGGRMSQWNDVGSLLNISTDTPQAYNSMLKDDGKAILPPTGIDPANLTKLHWTVSISGYSYKADSTAYYLSFAVLFLYIILALGHLLYSLYSQQSSDAWRSFEELLVLSHSSQPDPSSLKNTSAGIRCYSTLQSNVRIRAVDDDKCVSGQEELQLLFETIPDVGYKSVVVGEEYGAIDLKPNSAISSSVMLGSTT